MSAGPTWNEKMAHVSRLYIFVCYRASGTSQPIIYKSLDLRSLLAPHEMHHLSKSPETGILAILETEALEYGRNRLIALPSYRPLLPMVEGLLALLEICTSFSKSHA